MKVVSRLYFLDEQDEKFFGEGPYRLLKQVEETGSLHAAAYALGMAYTKATKLLKNAEKSLGFPLTVRKIGGKAGGGSVLTPEAKSFLVRYEVYRSQCFEHNQKLFKDYFGDIKVQNEVGCVIMASGLGKRFGGDKVMAELSGKPMLQYILDATEGVFARRVVVTRNECVKNWCEDRKIPTVFHDMPGRNDTIRLGLNALEAACVKELKGCVFCPADMPFVASTSLMKMLHLAAGKTDALVRMAYGEEVGSPVLFGKDYFACLKKLPQGKGGSEIIRANKDKLLFVEAECEQELWDVDTKEALKKAQEKLLAIKE